jgi:hypothetical protein
MTKSMCDQNMFDRSREGRVISPLGFDRTSLGSGRSAKRSRLFSRGILIMPEWAWEIIKRTVIK